LAFRFFSLVLVFTLGAWLPTHAANYADRLLDDLAQKTERLLADPDPVDAFLIAESLYYLSHESSQQERIIGLIRSVYDGAERQDLKAQLSYFLTQMYRQTGRYEQLEALISEMGYVPEWRALGPLAADRTLDLKRHLAADEVQGLNRKVQPQTLRAYGEPDYWSEGLGHFGFFSANNAMYPNQLAGALFTVEFFSPRRAEYRLGLGWSHVIKAWVNQTAVFEGEANQEPRPDQAAVHFRVRKGWHRLTLYTESDSEKPNLGFFARLTDAQGAVLQFRAAGMDRLSRRRARTLTPEAPSLADLAAARSPYALASLLLIREQLKHGRYGAVRDLLAQALADSPSRLVVEKLMSLSESPNERWQYLSAFLEGLPEKGLDRAWTLTNMGQIALGQDRFWEARHFADLAREADPDYWPAEILENNTLASLGLEGEALRHTLALHRQYPDTPWIMMDLSDLFWAMSFRDEAEKTTDAILAIRRGNAKYADRKIKILKARGDTAGLDAFYADTLRDSPYATSTLLGYAQFLSANGLYAKAESLLADALRQTPENPFLLEATGELKLRQEQPEALDYLQKALALRPQNPQLEKLITLSKTEETAFYEPYRLDAAPDVEVREVSPVVVNLNNTVVKAASNGQSSRYVQIEYEVMNEQGVQELTGHSFSYAPLRQKAEMIKAELYRGDKTILLTNMGRSRISDPAYRMYYDLVAFQIPFPALQVGDRIRLEYRVDDVDSLNIFGDYFGDQHYFADRRPTKRFSYTLIAPQNRKIHYHVEKMKPQFTKVEEGDDIVYTWTLDQVSPYETESRMPGLESYLPYVSVSTFSDWQQMARWYADLIKDQLTLNRETKQIVAELTEGVTDRLEIVKRIHEYVIVNTRYVALEFGIHGYKPYQVNQVCSRQFGDCKDKASLIVAMLREAGVPADIVIVRTADKGDVHPFPAMLAYFNHAIAYVPEFDLYLDGTAEFSGINELPEMDQGALVLIVDKDGVGKLTKIPIMDDNHQGVALDLNVQPGGSARVNGELSYRGSLTPEVRQYLSIDAKLAQNLQNLLVNLLPGLAVSAADRTGRGVNEPITLSFQGRTDQLLQVSDNRIKLPLNILGSQLTLAYAPNAQRKFPLELGSPNVKSIQLRVNIPEGFELEKAPEPQTAEDRNFRFAIDFDRADANQLLVNYRVEFKTHRIEPEEYGSFRSLAQAHDRLLDQTIQFIAR